MATLSRLYDFTAGNTIVSNEVDQEFNQLINGHNNHDSRLDTLEAATAGINTLYSVSATDHITTTSSSYVDITNMSITQTFLARDVLIFFKSFFATDNNGVNTTLVRLTVDGSELITTAVHAVTYESVMMVGKTTLTSGSHTIKAQWLNSQSETSRQQTTSVSVPNTTGGARILTVLQM